MKPLWTCDWKCNKYSIEVVDFIKNWSKTFGNVTKNKVVVVTENVKLYCLTFWPKYIAKRKNSGITKMWGHNVVVVVKKVQLHLLWSCD